MQYGKVVLHATNVTHIHLAIGEDEQKLLRGCHLHLRDGLLAEALVEHQHVHQPILVQRVHDQLSIPGTQDHIVI